MRRLLVLTVALLWLASGGGTAEEQPAGTAEKPEAKVCPAPPSPGDEPAYQEIEVKDGGRLAGRVKFEGEYTPKRWKVVKDKDFCGESVPDESLVTGPEGGLRYVAVSIDDIRAGKALPRTVKEVANKDCLYQPRVETFTVCDKVMITNHDPILHNSHAYIGEAVFEPIKPSLSPEGLLVITEEDYSRGYSSPGMSSITTLFNFGLPTTDFKPKKTLRQPGLVTLKCDVGHTWMTGFIIIKPHPYHTVTGADGSYAISDIPPGEYTVTFWHELLGEQKHKVSISPGQTATLDVTFTKK